VPRVLNTCKHSFQVLESSLLESAIVAWGWTIYIFSTIQEIPEKSKESAGGPWEFCGLLPLFDPPRHDSAETIRRALNLGVNVKMITGTWNSLGSKHPILLVCLCCVQILWTWKQLVAVASCQSFQIHVSDLNKALSVSLLKLWVW
jgi:hypothetical protein